MEIKTGELFIWGGGSTCWCERVLDLVNINATVTLTCYYFPDLYEVIGDL